MVPGFRQEPEDLDNVSIRPFTVCGSSIAGQNPEGFTKGSGAKQTHWATQAKIGSQ